MRNLLQAFHNIQTNEENNPFYFRNLVELCKDSPFIARTNEDFREKLHAFFFNSFLQLKVQGFVRSDVSDAQYTSFAFVIVMMASVWIQGTSPYYDAHLPSLPIAVAMTDLLYPYLTEQGICVFSGYHSQQKA